MASPLPPLIPRPDLVAVRVPGDGLTRFLRCDGAVATGSWVAIPGRWGDEPGLVVTPPGMVEATAEFEPSGEVTRQLPATEVQAVIERASRALELTEAARRLASEQFPGLTVLGWRFTLAGDAVCTISGVDAVALGGFEAGLMALAGGEVHLEPRDASAPLYGGLGRLRVGSAVGDTGDEGIRRRLDALSRVPRLGSTVAFPGGQGTLLGVSVRHREARLRLADGQEVAVPLDQIREV